MKAIPNPSAFPHFEIDALENGQPAIYYQGMNLRDYFAAKAMAEMINNFSMNQDASKEVASKAYLYADAMLAERIKQP